MGLTLFFADVLQSKSQASILPLDNANLTKSTLSHHSQEAKLIQAHLKEVSPSQYKKATRSQDGDRDDARSLVAPTCFPCEFPIDAGIRDEVQGEGEVREMNMRGDVRRQHPTWTYTRGGARAAERREGRPTG